MNVNNLILAIIIACVCFGCNNSDLSDKSITFSGEAYKGVITNAVVEIYDFSDSTKGTMLAYGDVTNSVFTIEDVKFSRCLYVEIKSNDSELSAYIDEENGNKILFDNLILKAIIPNPNEKESYTITPLTTIATGAFQKRGQNFSYPLSLEKL